MSVLTSNTRFDSLTQFPFQQLGLAALVIQTPRNSGLRTLADLEAYQPTIRGLTEGTYRGYRIKAAAPPSSGGSHSGSSIHGPTFCSSKNSLGIHVTCAGAPAD